MSLEPIMLPVTIQRNTDVIMKCGTCGVSRALSAAGWTMLMKHARELGLPVSCSKCSVPMIHAGRRVWARICPCGQVLLDHPTPDGCKLHENVGGVIFTDGDLKRNGQDWG